MTSKDAVAEKYILLRPETPSGASVAPDRDYLQIGEVAEQTGLTQRTLRYYEELQLLDPPTRMAGGFRLYSPRDVARVQHILRLKQLLGYSLADIKRIIHTEEAVDRWQDAGGPTGLQHVLDQLDSLIAGTTAQLDLLQRKIAEMEALRDELATQVGRLEERRTALLAEREGAHLHAASEYS